jgi:hypothetical protein
MTLKRARQLLFAPPFAGAAAHCVWIGSVMNRIMTEPNFPSRAKVTRFGLLLAGAVIAYIVAVMVFIIVN